MCPYPVFWGLTLYDLLLCAGVALCFVLFSRLADKVGVKRNVQSFTLFVGIFAVTLGYCSAVLFQALYNIKSLGRFEITMSTGATFYGGLIGGVVVFCVLYFGVGRLKFGSCDHFTVFFDIADCAVPGIALAHGLGRLGCLCAGCCHGALTDAWYGIWMHGDMGYARYVPVQLFEAIFLFLLCALLIWRTVKGKGFGLSVYLCLYGVWRFFVEYLRADYRGDSLVEALTPSQLIACLLILVGIGLVFLEKYVAGKKAALTSEKSDAGVADEPQIDGEK